MVSTYTPISTPLCVVDYDIAKQNADAMLSRASLLGCELRPHVKTHKTIEGCLLMTGGRRSRIVVSTLAELNFFIDAGFDDIIYAIPIAENRIETIAKYLKEGRDVKIVCDNMGQYENLLEFTKKNPDFVFGKFKILLMLAYSHPKNNESTKKITYVHGVGLDPYSESSLLFANIIDKSDIAEYEGVYIHAGHSYYGKGVEEVKVYVARERDCVVQFVKRLKTLYSIDSKNVGMGSTPTACVTLDDGLDGITELHAGNYFFFDTMQKDIGTCDIKNIALTVRCQVISVYEEQNSLLIDLGWTGTSAQGADTGYGEIISHPELKINSLKQETGEVLPKDSTCKITKEKYPVGTIITLAPYHACATAHQYENLFVEQNGKIVGNWKRCPPH